MDSPENKFSLAEAVSFRKPWKVREITAYKENLGEDSGAGYAAAQGSLRRTVALSARSQRACSSCATSQRALFHGAAELTKGLLGIEAGC